MYACVYFSEDATLSVVGKNNLDLTLEGDFNVKEKVQMKWRCRVGQPKSTFNGTIVRIGDEELNNFANKANSKILKHLKEVPKDVPEALFNFESHDSASGKRQRIQTQKIKESVQQETELSPKKRKKKECGQKGNVEVRVISTSGKVKEKVVESTAHAINKEILKNCITGQFGEEGPALDPEPLMPEVIKENTCSSETDALPILMVKEKNIHKSTSISDADSPSTTFAYAGTSVTRDFDTSLSSTWSLCNNAISTMDTNSTADTQQQMNNVVPVPTPEILDVIRGLCRPDVQEYLQRIVMIYSSQESQEYQSNSYYMGTIPHAQPLLQPLLPFEATVEEEVVQVEQQKRCSPRKHSTPIKESPKVKNVNVGGNLQGSEMAKLLEDRETCIAKDGLRKAVSAAKKSSRPVYTLCYKLLGEIFSINELAESRGQGLTSNKTNDSRPILDKAKISTIKDYVVIWCKKNSYNPPSEPTLNDAITERIMLGSNRKSK